MTPFEFTIIPLLVIFLLATLVFRSLKRIQRQSEAIEVAMRDVLAAYVKRAPRSSEAAPLGGSSCRSISRHPLRR